MHLAFDEGRRVTQESCPECGRPFRNVVLFITKDGNAHAICYADLHIHGGMREAWLNVIFGTWDEDAANDHITFGCRVGPVRDRGEPAASAIPAAPNYRDTPLFGKKLSREEALSHPRVQEFWDVVDFVLLNDPDVYQHTYVLTPPDA